MTPIREIRVLHHRCVGRKSLLPLALLLQRRKAGSLVLETLKRNNLPDVDKAMGWPKGRAVKEAEKVLDEVGSR